MRTNNSLEGCNNKFNGALQSMHPSLWKFIDKLKDFDESIYSDMLQWIDRKEPYSSKHWQQVEEQKIAVVRSQPNVGRIEYLRAVANRLA